MNLKFYSKRLCPWGLLVILCSFSPQLAAGQTGVPENQSTPKQSEADGQKTEEQKTEEQKTEEQKTDEQTAQQRKAEEQLKQQEKQRILGIIPAFNASNVQNAAPLSPRQKMRLALKSTTDPFTFAGAAVDAGINQLQDDFHGYGQGVAGYAKRFGASYTDTFNGTMLGNAILPIVLHQDPRYFRKGSGSVKSRIWYAALSTVRCKGDNGRWQPSFSNILGNLAAGGIANAYYPEADRGFGLTVKRAFTVSAEGVIGAMFYEFWPDISRKYARKHNIKTKP